MHNVSHSDMARSTALWWIHPGMGLSTWCQNDFWILRKGDKITSGSIWILRLTVFAKFFLRRRDPKLQGTLKAFKGTESVKLQNIIHITKTWILQFRFPLQSSFGCCALMCWNKLTWRWRSHWNMKTFLLFLSSPVFVFFQNRSA